MKKLINKFKKIAPLLSLLLAMNSFGQANYSAQALLSLTTNFTSLTNLVLTTNACKISQVIVVAGSAAVATVDMYDNNVTNMTFTNAQYITTQSLSSNLVVTNIGLAGITNIQTNSVLYTVPLTNAIGTNNLPFSTYVAPGNSIGTYNVNDINVRGIALRGNTNCTVIIRYRIND